MTDKKSIKPVEPNNRPGTPFPKCFDDTVIQGRHAKDGQFTTAKEARKHPKDHAVERVPKPENNPSRKKN